MAKKTISEMILSFLEGGAATAIDVTWAMMASKVESSRRWRELNHGRQSVGRQIINDIKIKHSDYKRYHAILSRLKKQNLVELSGTGKDKKWSLTQAGLRSTRLGKKNLDSARLVQTGGITIVSYDIPETMRKVRGQVRDLLKMLDFQQIQKSVWFAERKVTKDFIDELRHKKVLDFVHIFEVSKVGTVNRGENQK